MTQVNGDRAEASEIVQDVGVRLCRHLNGLRDPDAIRSWLYKLTIHTARDRRSRRVSEHAAIDRLTSKSSPDDVLLAPAQDDAVLDRERRDAVKRALRGLPPRERAVLRRRFGLGRTASRGEQTLEEIGDELGLSREGVRKAESRGVARLRARLQGRRERLL